MRNVHFIAIGGSAMHNLAIALQQKGIRVTGSDDEIFEPSLSRLQHHGLLPAEIGWHADKNIHSDLSAVIVGMHAKPDNPELKRALELNIPVYSYPEFIYQASEHKQRVVVAGSHGKTTITAMIMHVLKACKKSFDYLVGAAVEGFDNTVKITNDASLIIIEGDEYLASPTDRRPKFLLYQHHMTVISGIAWDHVNVFPTFDSYKQTFQSLVDASPKAGVVIYNEDDKHLKAIMKPIEREDLAKIPYTSHKHKVKDGHYYLMFDDEKIQVPFFGEHNMYNVRAAYEVCMKLGVSEADFYKAITFFKGAGSRLQLLADNGSTVVYKDFAHSPSKLQATIKAVSAKYPKKKLVAVYELHTFSSLNKDFLSQYTDTFDEPNTSVVYYNPETLKHKNLPEITPEDIKKGFNKSKLEVFSDTRQLTDFLQIINLTDTVVLLMSSGNFNGLNLAEWANQLLKK